jgi:hypothetical protein
MTDTPDYTNFVSRMTEVDTRVSLIQAELDRRFDTVLREQGSGDDRVKELLDQAVKALKELVEQHFALGDRALSAALASAEKAVTVANDANEKRLDSVNEFRAQQSDLIRSFLTRTEFNIAHQALIDKTDVFSNSNKDAIVSLDKKLSDRIASLELRLQSRLDLDQGGNIGAEKTITERRQVSAQTIAIITVIVIALSTVIGLIAHVLLK